MYKITLQNIEMKFGDFKALRDVNMEFFSGEVHTLLGENGAGKSTLISIIQGINKATRGTTIISDGADVKKLKGSVSDSKRNKIYVIPQHFELVSNTTVLDNILISTINKENFWVNRAEAKVKLSKLVKKYNIDLDVEEKISNLTIGKKQMVEVVRMLWNESQVIILDEPTAVLSKKEIKLLFTLINKLKAENKIIIFISHKLEEVFHISDKISVLRKGQLINTHVNNKKLTTKKLVDDMTNNSFVDKKLIDYDVAKKFNKELLKVENLSVEGYNLRNTLKDINFTVNSGEVVAIASIDGNGEETLFEALIGFKTPTSGNMYIKNNLMNNLSIAERYKNGMSFVPADRQHNGLILDFPIFSNLILHTHDDMDFYKLKTFFNYKKGREMAKGILGGFDVRGADNISNPIKALSGGNQQKVLVAREMSRDSDLLVLYQPTRGIDVKAIQNIYTKVFEAKKQGKGILLYTTELEEIESIADRVIVLSGGKVRNTLVHSNINKEKIMESLVK